MDSVGTDLVFVPILVASAVLLAARRPASLLACLAFVACVIADLWFGANLSNAAVVILLAVVGLAMLPERPTLTERGALWVCVAAQVAVAFVGLHHGLVPVANWLHRLASHGLPRL